MEAATAVGIGSSACFSLQGPTTSKGPEAGWRQAVVREREEVRKSVARQFYEAMGSSPDGATKRLDFGIPLQVVRYRRDL